MSTHVAAIAWRRTTPDFTYESYDRSHVVRWDSGNAVYASAAPEYRGDPARVDPEEMLVGSLASCHMLTFLAVAARKRLVVDAYEDNAYGTLEKDAEGRLSVTRVVLRPRVTFAPGTEVSAEQLARLHATAHDNCFIARSVRSEVVVERAGEG